LIIDGTQSVSYTRWDQDNEVLSIASSPIATNAWSHVVVSSDGTTTSLFVNGVVVAQTAAVAITADVAAQQLSYGARSDFSAEWFAGSLDEAAIYTHALSASRVLAHYNAALP